MACFMFLFGSFRKYYGLCRSEVPLGKFKRLNTQDFSIPYMTQQFFFDIYPQYLTNS